MAAGSSAQSGAGAAAADTAAAEAAPQKAAPPKPAAAKPDASKAAEGKATEGKTAAAPASRQVMPEPKALPPNLSGECAWTGKRIVSLLARDDVDQAKRFLEFYRLFACKEAHIAPTFRCVIASEQADNPSEEFADRVDRCWEEIE
jgi:nucleoid-associated protein YgaU